MKKIYHFIIATSLFLLTGAIFLQKHGLLSLSNALSYYGFSSEAQTKAIENLLKEADIIKKSDSLDMAFPKRESDTELARDLLMLVKATQEKFVMRTGRQERWEIAPSSWLEKNSEQNLQSLKLLGVVDAVAPIINSVDAICILGSTATNICING